jgi:hypothetical protein
LLPPRPCRQPRLPHCSGGRDGADDAAEITAYTAGFDNNEEFGDKEYVTEHDEDEKQVEEVEMRIDTSFRFAYEIRQDLLGA